MLGDAGRRTVYATSIDVSIDDGPGINEREFIRVLLDRHAERVVCVVPEPERPLEYSGHPALRVVRPTRRRYGRYPVHVASQLLTLLDLGRGRGLRGIAYRPGVLPFAPILASRLLRVPLLLKTVASRRTQALGGSGRRLLLDLAEPGQRAVLRAAAFADTVSETYREWLIANLGARPERLIVVPNGANVLHFTPGERAEARRRLGLGRFARLVGYVGALSAGLRHLREMLEAFASLPAATDTGLVLVGAGADQRRVADHARELGIADRVVLTGPVPYAQVPEHMRAFDIGLDLTCVPFDIRGTVVWGSFSQKIPQYLACACPVVAWDVGDNRFLTERSVGAVATRGDTAALAAALARLLAAGEREAAALGARCRAHAEAAFSIEHLADVRIGHWERVCAEAV